jgi:hypothetical protein
MSSSTWDDATLDAARQRGDSLADGVVSTLFSLPPDASAPGTAGMAAFARLTTITVNNDMAAQDERDDFCRLVAACDALPDWADVTQLERAEQIFKDGGVVSGLLFFCASLPEVYLSPDISLTLRATGDLETATVKRLRTTAAMILSVLLAGGLHKPQGSGRPKILKARFVHAVVRHAHASARHPTDAVGQALTPSGAPGMAFLRALSLSGDGIPCNQEELSYTLLTFGFVYLRSLRRLGIRLSESDEASYLHLWNVVGHLIGIDRALMAHTMDDAARLFDLMQQRAQRSRLADDPRPSLGGALLREIEKSIARPVLRPTAALLVRYLTSDETFATLGLHTRAHRLAQAAFAAFVKFTKCIDFVARFAFSEFSIARFLLRIVGYHIIRGVLSNADEPLDLPDHVRAQINAMLALWQQDPLAPKWMNHIEGYFTTREGWRESIRA